jgi:CRP/FNR family transcriptional regulator, cyclic AMP receptor protein
MVPALHAVVLMTYDWFSALPEAIQADVRAHARKCVLAPGERLFSRGDKPDGMYGVLEGSVRVSGISPKGREIILDFYGPGSWFGEVSALNGLSRGHQKRTWKRYPWRRY